MLCTRYVPALEELFTNFRELAWWRDPDECSAAIGKLLGDDGLRGSMREAGYSLSHREYSYTRMCERMLAALEAGA